MATNTPGFPYDTVVYITDTLGGYVWQGSGVLIAPNEVLTASHVVYNSVYGTATDIEVTPGYAAGAAPYGSAIGTAVHHMPISDPNDTIALDQSQNDYAVIHLSTSFTGLGTMRPQANYPGGAVNVTGYPAAKGGQLVNSPQTVTHDPGYTLLDGTTIGPGSSGGPVWTTASDGQPSVVGLVSSGEQGGANTGYFTQITTAADNQINAWVAQDDPATGGSASPTAPVTVAALAVQDATSGQSVTSNGQAYSGPVSGLQNEYINITADNLNVSDRTPGWFIHTGSGDDAITVASGTNVLDGGAGSNFLTGGTGADTFYVDDRHGSASFWDTIVDFHSGDAATVWGVGAGSSPAWSDGQGASGFSGLTLHVSAPGGAAASLTLADFTTADLSDGRLSVAYGTDASSGSAFMSIHVNG